MPDVGKTIAHFQLLEKLGEGGMGVVYKALDLKLHRTVVLKFIADRLSAEAGEQARLLAEARAAAALNHSGICSVIDILDHEGQKFIVMEFVEGEPLRSRMHGGALELSEILEYGLQIADALRHAHQRGVIHRDIKPENIIISRSHTTKVMDFGLARQSGRTQLTRDGAVVGTVAYMSPEQARGDTVDTRTDIWSFGAVLYEAATGLRPFPSDYEQAVIYGILNQTPASPRSINPAVPEDLASFILRCLAKSPDARYSSMEDCCAELASIHARHRDSLKKEKGGGLSGNVQRKRVALLAGVVILVALSAIAFLVFQPATQAPGIRTSIAVLPFENLSDREEDAYFAEGLTEDIITQLGTVPGLKVIGRSSVMRYKGANKSYHEVSDELGVATLLAGSVRHVGGKVRVVAHLVDHETGEDLWNETFDRNLQDILAIQTDIANRIAAALDIQFHGRMVSGDGKRLDLQAWRLYQQGKTEWYKRTTEGTKAAIQFFEQALVIEPDFALAHAGLADALARLGDTGVIIIRPAEAFEKAKREALKAISLDENLAEGHASLGHIQIHHFEWADAERSLRLALKLNPNSPTARIYMALYWVCVGNNNESRESMQDALLVDPLSGFTTSTAALGYLRTGDEDSAVALMKRMISIDPSSPRLHFTLGRVYAAMRLPDEALKEFRIAQERENNTEIRASIAHALALAGRSDEALALIDSLTTNMSREFVDPVRIAEVYVGLGRKSEALDWLEKALTEDSAGIIFLKGDPWYADLRSEPRFKSILKKMGIES